MEDVSPLEGQIGVSFHDQRLLRQALVHSSFLNENPHFSLDSNERLEFLGDAFIGLVVAEELYQRFPDASEGALTEMRAALVRRKSLASIGKDLGLGRCLYLGLGEEAGGGRERASNLADALEALIGAALVDQGHGEAKRLVLRLLATSMERLNQAAVPRDVKSLLQELVQGRGLPTPTYQLAEASGPDHARDFSVDVLVGDRVLGSGRGPRKGDAEREAAAAALEALAQDVREAR